MDSDPLTMSTAGAKVLNILEAVVCAGLIGMVLYIWLKKSDDPARLIAKWAVTAVMVGITWWVAASKIAASGGGLDYGTAFVVVIACAICGVVLGITWGSEIGGLLGKPLASLYDGGDVEVTPGVLERPATTGPASRVSKIDRPSQAK